MGVYIKGMEMPKGCPCELIGIGYDLSCSFAGGVPARVKEYYECCQNGTRPFWCPLVPVPEHGRLIVNAPAADVVPVRHGRNISNSGFLCSECHFGDFGGFHGYNPNYCPNCGAKMDGEA